MHCKGGLNRLLSVGSYLLVSLGIFVEDDSKRLHFYTYFICIIFNDTEAKCTV